MEPLTGDAVVDRSCAPSMSPLCPNARAASNNIHATWGHFTAWFLPLSPAARDIETPEPVGSGNRRRTPYRRSYATTGQLVAQRRPRCPNVRAVGLPIEYPHHAPGLNQIDGLSPIAIPLGRYTARSNLISADLSTSSSRSEDLHPEVHRVHHCEQTILQL
jgi:hypothetical protein